LGRDAPDFLDQGPPKQKPKNSSNTAALSKKKDLEAEEAFMREQERLLQQQEEQERLRMQEQDRLRLQEQERQRQMLEQQDLQQKQYQAELARQQQEKEQQLQRQRQEALQQQQQQQFLQMQNVNQQLEWYRQQNARDRDLLGQYEARVAQLSNEMGLLRINAQAGGKAKDLESMDSDWAQQTLTC
jgi:hypothetical protein